MEQIEHCFISKWSYCTRMHNMHKSHGSSHPNIDQVWWVYTVIDTAKHKEWKEIVWRLKLSQNAAIAFLLAFCQDLLHVKIYVNNVSKQRRGKPVKLQGSH